MTIVLTKPYRSPLRRRAQLAIVVLVIIALVGVWAVVSGLTERDLLQRMRDGGRYTWQEVEDSDARQEAIGFIQIGLLAVSGITFVVWLRQARLNLDAFGATELRFSSRWTWLGFIIPIMNLFRPYQVTAEIWSASRPSEHGSGHYGWDRQDVGGLVKVWWASWLFLQVIGRGLRRTYANAETVDQLLSANLVEIILDSSYVLGAGLAILLIWKLTQRQEETHDALVTASAQPAPA